MSRLAKVELVATREIMTRSKNGWLLCFTPEFRRWLNKNLGKQTDTYGLRTTKRNVWHPQTGYRYISYGSKFTITTNNKNGAALLKLMRGYVD